jgi:hypothetical protein
VLGELRASPQKPPDVVLRWLVAAVLVLALVPLAARADLAPKLAVYDLTVSGAVPASVGVNFAAAIASELRAAGDIDVVTGASNLPPARYRDDAKAQGADYYLSGAVAQVGTRYSVLCELVSTRTGLLVWSSTLQATTAADLRGQGALARQVLFDRLGRSAFPTAAATPQPAGLVASGALATPTPAPATYAVVTLGGAALPSDRDFAQRAILETIRGRGASAVTDSMQPQDLAVAGAQACMDTGAATIVGGTLATVRIESASAAPPSTASIALQVYDCRTQTLYGKPLAFTKAAPISSDAIRDAAVAAIGAYFNPSPAPHG